MTIVTAIVETFGKRFYIKFELGPKADLFTILDKINRHGNHISHTIRWQPNVEFKGVTY